VRASNRGCAPQWRCSERGVRLAPTGTAGRAVRAMFCTDADCRKVPRPLSVAIADRRCCDNQRRATILVFCPELTDGCRKQSSVHRFLVKLWGLSVEIRRILNSKYGSIVIVTTPPIRFPSTCRRSMILAPRQQLSLAKSEVTIGPPGIERLKLMLTSTARVVRVASRTRRTVFPGPSSQKIAVGPW